MTPKNPIQPIVVTQDGKVRFKENKIITYLWERGHINLNALATVDFPQDDRQQFAQLLGYSLDGYADLDYHSHEVIAAADLMHQEKINEQEARLKDLRGTLDILREELREPIARLYNIHPSDLGRPSDE